MFKNPLHNLMLNLLGVACWPYNIHAVPMPWRILLMGMYFLSIMALLLSAYRCKFDKHGENGRLEMEEAS